MPKSMTGFARKVEQSSWGELACEVRSVNHRYLEPNIRLPDMLRILEPEVHGQLRKNLHRGKVEVNFHLSFENHNELHAIQVNTKALNSLIELVDQVCNRSENIAAADPIQLLQWPGVVGQTSKGADRVVDVDMLIDVGRDVLRQALSALAGHRKREGALLKTYIDDRLNHIVEYASQIREQMPLILEGQKEKLQKRVDDFASSFDKNRIEQELVLLINKADITEELDRLDAHLVEVRHILNQSGAIGRRLDFMMQELNREANTLSSKSLTSDITQAAVSIKVLVEQIREQVQNIE